MSYKVDVVFLKEVESIAPWSREKHLVYPLAVLDDVASFLLVHHYFALLFDGVLVAAYTRDEVHVGEELFCLLQHPCMADVVHVEHSITVDPCRVVSTETHAVFVYRRPYVEFTL